MSPRGAVLLLTGLALALSLVAVAPPARAADPAPSWTLTDIDGNNVSSAALRGHVVVLDFAGTWCEPCKIVEAAFEEIYPTYAAKDVIFLSVFEPPANTVTDVQNYRTTRGVPWNMAPDTDGVSSRYSVFQIPRFFVIDGKGYATFDWASYPGFTQASVKTAAVDAIDGALAALASGPAPSWALTDVDGNNMSSAALRGRVVVLEFANTSCAPCGTVEAAFQELYPTYSAKGVVFLTVFLAPGNSPSEIVSYRGAHAIPWHVAADNGTAVNYSVYTPPRFYVVDQDQWIRFNWTYAPGQTQASIRDATRTVLDHVLGGDTGLSITTVSIPILLVIAAVLSFFSPCSFPVLPAFMAFYLNLDAKGAETAGTKATTKTAAGRGFVASLGIVTIYGIIALALLAAGIAAQAAVGQAIVWLPPIIGVILILFGILTLLPFQYHFLTRPFSALKKRIAARLGTKWTPGLKAKLFAFGMGYGAAGFACVAPPFIAAVLYAATLGSLQEAALGLLLYVVVVIALMIVIVVAIHTAGDRVLKKIRAWSGIIKYVSAAALIIAGIYLLWLFLSTSVFVG